MEEEFLYKDLTYAIIGAAMEVHKILGNGYWEYVYEEALCYELTKRAFHTNDRRRWIFITRTFSSQEKYRADLFVEGRVIVDNKATSGLTENDEAQLLNYLKGQEIKLGCF